MIQTIIAIANVLGFGFMAFSVYILYRVIVKERETLSSMVGLNRSNHEFISNTNASLMNEIKTLRDDNIRLRTITSVDVSKIVGDPLARVSLSEYMYRSEEAVCFWGEDYRHYNRSVSHLMENIDSNWPTILLVSGLLESSDSMIENLLSRGDSEYLTLSILCARNSNSVSKYVIHSIFLKVGSYYHVASQVPTYLIARQLKHIGINGIDGLSDFLQENYYDIIDPRAGLDSFISMDRARMRRSRLAPLGMLRRLAIDSIGSIDVPESIEKIIETFETYCKIENEFWKDKNTEMSNEWQHNVWHLLYAMHNSAGTRSVEYLRNKIDTFERDVIAYSELIYHISSFSDEIISSEHLDNMKERLYELREALRDDFAWRRAHACEAIMRISKINEDLHETVRNEFTSSLVSVANEDVNYMVSHYAFLALGVIGDYDNVDNMLEKIMDDDSEPWVRYAACVGIVDLLKRCRKTLNSIDISRINHYLKSRILDMDRDDSGTVLNNIVISSMIDILRSFGNADSVSVLNLYTDKNIYVMGRGSVSDVAKSALGGCMQRIELALSKSESSTLSGEPV